MWASIRRSRRVGPVLKMEGGKTLRCEESRRIEVWLWEISLDKCLVYRRPVGIPRAGLGDTVLIENQWPFCTRRGPPVCSDFVHFTLSDLRPDTAISGPRPTSTGQSD
ncbi:hypothetical protein RRG08_005102 [Elysia crispata]|uniref:Uncharacterized protein n=1 Tax=Elysia crispata TaxID=231223 RepID=A0AAE0YCW1_9GAST|nr:hypothetical protein RRG08_005102 [Elysia crispata]